MLRDPVRLKNPELTASPLAAMHIRSLDSLHRWAQVAVRWHREVASQSRDFPFAAGDLVYYIPPPKKIEGIFAPSISLAAQVSSVGKRSLVIDIHGEAEAKRRVLKRHVCWQSAAAAFARYAQPQGNEAKPTLLQDFRPFLDSLNSQAIVRRNPPIEPYYIDEKSWGGHRALLDRALNRLLRREPDAISQTNAWHVAVQGYTRYDPSCVFFSDPPVSLARRSDRTLVVGTKAECSNIREMISRGDLSFTDDSILQAEISASLTNITYCGEAILFWARFFGTDEYLDDPRISIPARILSTGSIRNYSASGGETLSVSVIPRLKGVAAAWSIPVHQATIPK